jgi:hypothetical protein
MLFCSTQKRTRAIRPRGKPLLTSQFAPQRTNERHADRPGKLNLLDVLADRLPVLRLKLLQSFTHRLFATIKAVEACRQALKSRTHRLLYQFWYRWSIAINTGAKTS